MSRFLSAYRAFLEKTTDTPSEFIEASGLACLSGITMGRRWIARGSEIKPNLFMMLIAGSSRDRKSHSIEQATEMLRDVEENRIGPDDFTAEALATQMAVPTKPNVPHRNVLYVGIEEFGLYLAQSASYGLTSNALLCKLYDGNSFSRARQTSKNIFVDKPRLTIFAACAFAMFERYADPKDWNTGFYARFLFVPGITKRPRNDIQPPAALHEKELARAMLTDLRNELVEKVGPVPILPATEEVFRAQSPTLGEESTDPAEQASKERLSNTIWKLALLYQTDINPALPIGPEAMTLACNFAQTAWTGFQSVYRQTAGDDFTRTMKRVWKDVSEAGEAGIQRSALLRKHHLAARVFDQILKLLVSNGVVAVKDVAASGVGRSATKQVLIARSKVEWIN